MTGNLKLERTIGFNGTLTNGLHMHPDGEHMIYALGSTVVIQDRNTLTQTFLRGHTNTVSCIAISPSGRFIANAQETHMGFKADIIVWDYEKKEQYCRFSLHKVNVEALSFSYNDKYLVSLGGQDDGSVVVWDLETKDSICGAPAAVASAGNAMVVEWAKTNDIQFVTAGDLTIRVWTLDKANRKIRPVECQLAQIKRCINCVEISPDDTYFYCGTTSGDILKINMQTCKLIVCGPEKKEDKFTRGVTAIKGLTNGNLIVANGAGSVALVKSTNAKKYQRIKVFNVDTKKCGSCSITSVALRCDGHEVYVGTTQSEIYKLSLCGNGTGENMKWESPNPLVSCHHNKVYDIAFYQGNNGQMGTSDLFATCGAEDIRIWDAKRYRELRRIRKDNLICHAIEFTPDGHSILSAWNDNKIRAFGPISGREMYCINNAHNLGVTALAVTPNSRRIVSGGGEGQVRVWDLTLGPQYCQQLRETLKEHKSKVSCIKIKSNGLECVSSSEDGTVIIWDLERFVRLQMVMANTLFECVSYHPEEYQILTSGTDRKVAYWETYDGSQIRELDGSDSGGINGLDIDRNGKFFVTGGVDTMLKVWDYHAGEVKYRGIGHADAITKVKISPNGKLIVSVSSDGGIIAWTYPE